MDTCAKCGAGLGVGRFCLNCGHPIGAPVSREEQLLWARAPASEPLTAAPVEARPEARTDPPPAVEPEAEDDWLLADVDDTDDAPRLHWVAWLVGATVLVVLAILAVAWLDSAEDPATDEPETQATSSPAAPEESGTGDETTNENTDEGSGEGAVTMPEGDPVDVARGATVTVPATAPPTTDLDGNLVAYVASQMVDGRPATAWRMAGDGTGAEVRLVLPQESVIDQVGIINGYAKRVGAVDWYPNNRRILAVRWTFDDGTTVDQSLTEQPRLQRLGIDPELTGAVTLTILAVTPPGPGPLGRDYTPISSVVLTGLPAG